MASLLFLSVRRVPQCVQRLCTALYALKSVFLFADTKHKSHFTTNKNYETHCGDLFSFFYGKHSFFKKPFPTLTRAGGVLYWFYITGTERTANLISNEKKNSNA